MNQEVQSGSDPDHLLGDDCDPRARRQVSDDRLAADSSGDPPSVAGPPGVAEHVRAFIGERLREGRAQPARRAGDEGEIVTEM